MGWVRFRLTRKFPLCPGREAERQRLIGELRERQAELRATTGKKAREDAGKAVSRAASRVRSFKVMHGSSLVHIKSATVTLKSGRWHVSFSMEWEQADPVPASPEDQCLGIDRGVAIPLATSEGEEFHLPDSIRDTFEEVEGRSKRKLSKLERRKRLAQRKVCRRRKWIKPPTQKNKGKMAPRDQQSKRYWRAVEEFERLNRRITNTRQHWQHELTTALARSHKLIAIEKLNTKNMTKSAKGTAEEPGKRVKQKSGLNRAILAVGWYAIEKKLAYKLEERGGALIKVPAAYTSQTCSECGTVDADNRKNQAEFKCQHCGHTENADLNAAKAIAAKGDEIWYKGTGGTLRSLKGVESLGGVGRDGSLLRQDAEALTKFSEVAA